MPLDQIPEPWRSFLSEVDAQLEDPVTFICLGGFVLTVPYDLRRPTSDIDVIEITRNSNWKRLTELAGRNSQLHRKYHVYLDPVAVAQYPEDFESRLQEIPHAFHQLRLFALDPYDLVLSKLDRNSQKASVITSKPAIHDHFKTGHRDRRPGLGGFYASRSDLSIPV